MSYSVRLGFIDWLKGVRNHLTQQAMKVLCGSEIHSKAARNLNELFVPSIPNNAAESQGYDAHMLTGFHQQIDIMNRSAIIPDFQPLITQRECPSGRNYPLISHQKPPYSQSGNFLKLNHSGAGVESP